MLFHENKLAAMIGVSRDFFIFVTKYFLWVFIYVTPIHSFLITIFILLFFDLITGITKAFKNSQPITSRRMRDTVVKLVFYTIAVFISYQVDVTLLSTSALLLTKLVGGYIMLIEFQSNIENISAITGVNIWMAIKDKVIGYFNTKISQPDIEPKQHE